MKAARTICPKSTANYHASLSVINWLQLILGRRDINIRWLCAVSHQFGSGKIFKNGVMKTHVYSKSKLCSTKNICCAFINLQHCVCISYSSSLDVSNQRTNLISKTLRWLWTPCIFISPAFIIIHMASLQLQQLCLQCLFK